MCMSKAPSFTPPTPPQEAKQPEMPAGKKRSSAPGAAAASTLLTGPSGIDNAQLKLGKSSLLGG